MCTHTHVHLATHICPRHTRRLKKKVCISTVYPQVQKHEHSNPLLECNSHHIS